MDKFFDIVKEVRPDVKVHAFGITVLKVLERYPFTSCDSTSYIQTAINGSIFTECLGPVKLSAKTEKDPKHFAHYDEQRKNLVLQEVEKYGYKIEDLATSHNSRLHFNVDYFIRWQKNFKFKEVKKVRKGSLLANV